MAPSTCALGVRWRRRRLTRRVSDIDAVWFDPDPTSKSGRSVRVIGYSRSRRAVLTVILVHRDEGGYWGANGWESSLADRRRYEKGE
jgi:hypothetical protein